MAVRDQERSDGPGLRHEGGPCATLGIHSLSDDKAQRREEAAVLPGRVATDQGGDLGPALDRTRDASKREFAAVTETGNEGDVCLIQTHDPGVSSTLHDRERLSAGSGREPYSRLLEGDKAR